MRQIHTSLAFDMRAPDWGTPASELYPSAIEMAAVADRIGVTSINLMEHHGSKDGYLPQPFSLCAAMASVTSRIQFSLGAVLLPLHDPVMVAEKLAIDAASGGNDKALIGADGYGLAGPCGHAARSGPLSPMSFPSGAGLALRTAAARQLTG